MNVKVNTVTEILRVLSSNRDVNLNFISRKANLSYCNVLRVSKIIEDKGLIKKRFGSHREIGLYNITEKGLTFLNITR